MPTRRWCFCEIVGQSQSWKHLRWILGPLARSPWAIHYGKHHLGIHLYCRPLRHCLQYQRFHCAKSISDSNHFPHNRLWRRSCIDFIQECKVFQIIHQFAQRSQHLHQWSCYVSQQFPDLKRNFKWHDWSHHWNLHWWRQPQLNPSHHCFSNRECCSCMMIFTVPSLTLTENMHVQGHSPLHH